ncbi:MAG: phosphatidate cytidylyltransferase [Gammaproteobacteria bacterium]|nr:phosphatidate cytidylyltransferase [Gammaproteobacteria bacterium]
MLRQRVITGVTMVVLFLAALAFLPLVGLAVLFAVLVSLGAWEWSRLAGLDAPVLRALYVGVTAACCAALFVVCELAGQPARDEVQPFLGFAGFWWSFALLWIKGYPSSAVFWRTRVMRGLMGLLILVPAWLAAVYLLSFPRGGGLLLVMVLIVVAADVGAYFTGKAFGKHQLAAAVSPKKTWEGFWGGAAACSTLAVLFWIMLPNQIAHLSLGAIVAVTLATSMASVVGDLTVSMVKRQSGVKDSGTLLPGHGGILDRLDSLCAAAPVFVLGLLLAGWQ